MFCKNEKCSHPDIDNYSRAWSKKTTLLLESFRSKPFLDYEVYVPSINCFRN